MSLEGLAPWLRCWSASLLGCASILAVDLLPEASLSWPLLGQLAWLALLGSIPTTLVLASADRAARESRSVVWLVAAVILLLGVALSWSHTDFLLAGPRWAMHSGRPFLRVAMALALGALGAAGWWWLVVTTRAENGRAAVLTGFATVAIVSVCIVATRRYRAYDFTAAQLVFPCGALAAGFINGLLARDLRLSRASVALSAALALAAAGSRTNATWTAIGEREMLAHSRAGTLVSLYVLPHVGAERSWSAGDHQCDAPRRFVESGPLPMPNEQRRNVIVISVDALRRDVVGALVAEKEVTPELSRYARAGISFARATTTYPATLFAIGSAFTGLSPAELYLSPSLPDTIFTLSRAHVDRQLVVLPEVGWFRLPIVRELLAPDVEAHYAMSDASATRALIAELDAARAADESVMAWIHYYAPHDPYGSHSSGRFGKGRKNAYLGDVAYFDAQLGALMRHLESSRWLDDTLVIFFSDHGEALGEDGYFGHHVYLDGWMIDVPLVIWHAALDPAEPTVGVSVADIAPTILHFLGIPQSSGLRSQSLFTLDPDAVGRATFSEAFPVRGRELFETFRLRSLDDETLHDRLRSIRVSSKGYEPKGAVRKDDERLIHHRSAGRGFVEPTTADEAALREELDRWEADQLDRIQCGLRVTAPPR